MPLIPPATEATLLAQKAKIEEIAAEDFATQVTLAAVLAKLTADPATQTTLAAILAKIIAAPATETTAAAILAKLIAAPATEATLALIKAKTDNLDVLLSTRTKPADTQPVSGPLTDTQLRATAVPVSGPVTDAQLRAAAVPVSGPLTDAQLRASAVPVLGPTLTKGTQGSTGYSVQALSDAGRNTTNLFMAAPIITTAAEVMMSLTGYKSGAAVGATPTPAVVTAGKTYRVTRIGLTYFNVAAVGSARFTLRANLSGVAVITSPLVASWQVGISGDGASTAGHVTTRNILFPNGLDFAAGTGIAIGMQGFGAVPTTGAVVGYGKVEIEGSEF